ncbi:MAG: hypothetical protein AAFP76_17525 [Bacteroidota bacterium]
MKFSILICLSILLFSCSEEIKKPKAGLWRATLEVQENKQLPFIFEWKDDNSLVIMNAEERIPVTQVYMESDSITIEHPVFEGVFKGVYSEEKISGNFVKPSLDRVVPFEMVYGDSIRFKKTREAVGSVDGSWEMVFSAHSKEDRYIAKGIFEQGEGDKVTGTIRNYRPPTQRLLWFF